MTYLPKSISFVAFALSMLAGTAAMADTTVVCKTPQIEVNSGRGEPARIALHCLGGSSVAGINYYAVEISANPTVALMIQELYASFLTVHKTATSVTLSSNIADVSGDAWGCAENNCRVLDYAIGQ